MPAAPGSEPTSASASNMLADVAQRRQEARDRTHRLFIRSAATGLLIVLPLFAIAILIGAVDLGAVVPMAAWFVVATAVQFVLLQMGIETPFLANVPSPLYSEVPPEVPPEVSPMDTDPDELERRQQLEAMKGQSEKIVAEGTGEGEETSLPIVVHEVTRAATRGESKAE
jgi:hypothetical protein